MANYTKHYRLPSGDTTTDVDQYITEWRQLAEPIEKALNLTLMAFDPDFSFRQGNSQSNNYKSVTLPVWFVTSLTKSLT